MIAVPTPTRALGDTVAAGCTTLSKRAPGASLTWLLELLADPRTVDPRTWLMLHTETRHAAAGYTSQTARVWDDARRPVAVSHQTTAIFD